MKAGLHERPIRSGQLTADPAAETTSERTGEFAGSDHRWPRILALEAILLAIGLMILDFTAQWLYAPDGAGISGSGRAELVADGMPAYERSMFDLPLLAYVILVIVALILAVPKTWNLRQRRIVDPELAPPLIVIAGMVLLANAAQWFGFTRARLDEYGGPIVEMGEVPWIHAATGIGLSAAGLYAIIRSNRSLAGSRWTASASIVAVIALIIMPLIPFARVPLQSGSLVIDMVAIAAISQSNGSGSSAAGLIIASYTLLWITFAVLGLAVLLARLNLAARRQRLAHRVLAILGVVLSAAGILASAAGIAQVESLHVDAVRGWNFIAPLGFACVLVLSAISIRRTGNRAV